MGFHQREGWKSPIRSCGLCPGEQRGFVVSGDGHLSALAVTALPEGFLVYPPPRGVRNSPSGCAHPGRCRHPPMLCGRVGLGRRQEGIEAAERDGVRGDSTILQELGHFGDL